LYSNKNKRKIYEIFMDLLTKNSLSKQSHRKLDVQGKTTNSKSSPNIYAHARYLKPTSPRHVNLQSSGGINPKPRIFNSPNNQTIDEKDEQVNNIVKKESTSNLLMMKSVVSEVPTGFLSRSIESPELNSMEKKMGDSNATFSDILNSKLISQKSILSKSYQLSQLRKKCEQEKTQRAETMRPLTGNNIRPRKKAGADKTLTRFIDQLILAGNLPLEAIEYFSGEPPKEKVERKSVRSSANNSPMRPSVSSCSDFPVKNPRQSTPMLPPSSIVPHWMSNSTKFAQILSTKKKHSKHPLYKVFSKGPAERDLTQHAFVAKWLGSMQIFSNVSYDKLFDMGKALDHVYLEAGEVLCHIGDPADSAYILYDGQIEIISKPVDAETVVGKANPGDVLGRQALEQVGKRTAKLRALKSSFLVSLKRYDYLTILGGVKNAPVNSNNMIQDFVTSHDFLNTFSEVKKHLLVNNLVLTSFIKNEVIYPIDSISDKIFIVVSGKVCRRMPVTVDKANKWPTGLSDWRICKIIKTYAVTLPIAQGEIFGVSEMIAVTKRKEHVLVEEDAQVLYLTRDMFYQIFDEDDVFKFQKKVLEDDKKKAERIRRMFDQQEKLEKIKSVAMSEAFNFNLQNKSYSSFREINEKVLNWKRFEKGMTQVKTANKVVVAVQEIIKDVHSVYET